MELQLVNNRTSNQVMPTSERFEDVEYANVDSVQQEQTKVRTFIEANTEAVSLEHLKNDCIVPTFKDCEKTISHYEMIDAVEFATQQYFGGIDVLPTQIRISHPVQGRIPSALHKKVAELEEYEKTRYYERMMFMIEIPSITEVVNGNRLNLSICGIRALNHESLFSKKSIEKFKVIIGFKNLVCTNLLVSTDGAALEIKVSSYDELIKKVLELISQFNIPRNLHMLQDFGNYKLSEHQFAQIIGKSRLYQYLAADVKKNIPSLEFNDTQINTIARDYYFDKSFCRDESGDIDLWRLYGLFTGANKSSYIDSFLNRAVNATTFTQELTAALAGKSRSNWFIS
jgi:hypothetical protein